MKNYQPRIALLIIDMINDFDFDEGDDLLRQTVPIASNIAALKKKVKEYSIPVIYVNDNYGRWQSDFQEIIEHCKRQGPAVKKVSEKIMPESEDYFVLKPQFSGFFYTPLDMLLRRLDVRSLILTGVAGNMCVHFTANDAYMRGYELIVPSDGSASNTKAENDESLRMMNQVLGADITSIEALNIEAVLTRANEHYKKMD